MNIAWMKYEKDKQSFHMAQNFGMPVILLKDPEEVDEKIEELVKQDYNTFVLSNEIASFSGDMIKKYAKSEKVKIIISPGSDSR